MNKPLVRPILDNRNYNSKDSNESKMIYDEESNARESTAAVNARTPFRHLYCRDRLFRHQHGLHRLSERLVCRLRRRSI
ncbi:hypothetical protein TorRG33x02_019620 [Trema orientale]|uniref:Uncharacterized protein n=1 Tax=Trema orientale TaxID=63057 RepID=A0A2P5FWL9_TREOI|nr:hypothetical protein TorRG33x02_019620 [Trema orientale]